MRKVLIAFSLAVLASVLSLVLPAYTGMTRWQTPVNREASSAPQNETPVHPASHATLSDVNGPGTYFLLAIPVVISGPATSASASSGAHRVGSADHELGRGRRCKRWTVLHPERSYDDLVRFSRVSVKTNCLEP
jgi:hypothetical protein